MELDRCVWAWVLYWSHCDLFRCADKLQLCLYCAHYAIIISFCLKQVPRLQAQSQEELMQLLLWSWIKSCNYERHNFGFACTSKCMACILNILVGFQYAFRSPFQLLEHYSDQPYLVVLTRYLWRTSLLSYTQGRCIASFFFVSGH